MKGIVLIMLVVSVMIATPNEGFAGDLLLNLGAEQLVQADSLDIDVPGYSVPSFVDWDNDGLNDLVVGQGSGSYPAKVRVYINEGTESSPQFSNFFFAQSNGSDLTCPGEGCLGCFPRVVYWDADARKDLLIGQSNGTVMIFLNTGTDEAPTFDSGTAITAGPLSEPLDVGRRATPDILDWNNDGKTDLVVGALDGKIHLYINCGCGGAIPPSFLTSPVEGIFVQENGADLLVPSARSSPVVLDLDGDSKKDILTGNTNGELLFYSNTGTDNEPNFAGYFLVEANGVPIDLPGTPRSRPFVCDWTSDGYFDVLIGASDGLVHLYQSIPQPGDLDKDYDVDLNDFALFASCWGPLEGDQCDGADLIDDGIVDMRDVLAFADWWLEGIAP